MAEQFTKARERTNLHVFVSFVAGAILASVTAVIVTDLSAKRPMLAHMACELHQTIPQAETALLFATCRTAGGAR